MDVGSTSRVGERLPSSSHAALRHPSSNRVEALRLFSSHVEAQLLGPSSSHAVQQRPSYRYSIRSRSILRLDAMKSYDWKGIGERTLSAALTSATGAAEDSIGRATRLVKIMVKPVVSFIVGSWNVEGGRW